MKILWIAFVWPEPTSSAAGYRTLQLIEFFREEGHEVRVASPCKSNQYREKLEEEGISTVVLEANNDQFDTYLIAYQPDLVVFDRFMIEEQFGWRVRRQYPQAIRLLDTIDLHSLRRSRQRKIHEKDFPGQGGKLKGNASEDAIREVSAIFRCDLSLVISDVELELLADQYKIPRTLIHLCRIAYSVRPQPLPFESRSHFAVIGNFNHPPNLDSFRVLHKTVWQKIRERVQLLRSKGAGGTTNSTSDLPIELHIYGAYPTEGFLKLDNPLTGFRVKGWVKDAQATLEQYRVNLAPLRFGAGIKGKVADGWAAGTPCVGTSIAAEGMGAPVDFGGLLADDWDAFADCAALLFLDHHEWELAQRKGQQVLSNLFQKLQISSDLHLAIQNIKAELDSHREKNFIGSMLWYHGLRSTEYFSRWIEAKNRKNQ